MRHLKIFVGVCCACLLLFAPSISAQSGYPDFESVYLNDFANVLEPSQELEIEETLSALFNKTDVEVTVLTVDSFMAYGTGDDTIEAFATNLFNSWGIGDSEKNNGILLLLAIEERGVRIETGVGWENRLQADTDRIVETVLLPKLRDGDLGEAMVAGANEIADAVEVELEPDVPTSTPTPVPRETRRVISTRVVGVSVVRDESTPNPPRVVSVSEPAFVDDRGFTIQRLFNWVIGLVSLGAMGAGGYFLSRPPKCKHCDRPMRRLNDEQDDEYLNSGQKVEERINSVEYDVWVCDYDDYVIIHDRPSYFSQYKECPQCKHKTLYKSTRVTKRATTSSTGTQKITKTCKHCDYKHSFNMTLPKIVEYDNDSSSGFSSSSSRRSSSSSSFGSSSRSSSRSSSSSSSRSFGGGHSSGRGSSGSW